jgi:hypothetical protein
MAVWMTEIMPAHVRVTSFSFAYNIAVALFGGFTPAISTLLIHETGNAAIGGVWLSIAAVADVFRDHGAAWCSANAGQPHYYV